MACRFDGADCAALIRDKAYFEHPDAVPITSQKILAALRYGGREHPRFLLGFQCDEFGWSRHDRNDKPGGIKHHVWPVWDGVSDNPDISERNGGVLYIKAVGGHINWILLGKKNWVRAHHADHYMSLLVHVQFSVEDLVPRPIRVPKRPALLL